MNKNKIDWVPVSVFAVLGLLIFGLIYFTIIKPDYKEKDSLRQFAQLEESVKISRKNIHFSLQNNKNRYFIIDGFGKITELVKKEDE